MTGISYDIHIQLKEKQTDGRTKLKEREIGRQGVEMSILSRNEKRKILGNQQEILIFFSLIHPPTTVDYIVQGVRLCCAGRARYSISTHPFRLGRRNGYAPSISPRSFRSRERESDRVLFCFVFLLPWQREINEAKSEVQSEIYRSCCCCCWPANIPLCEAGRRLSTARTR